MGLCHSSVDSFSLVSTTQQDTFWSNYLKDIVPETPKKRRTYTEKQKYHIFQRTQTSPEASGRCFYCNSSFKTNKHHPRQGVYQIDHYYPFSEVKTSEHLFNLVPCCLPCNNLKSNTTRIHEFLLHPTFVHVIAKQNRKGYKIGTKRCLYKNCHTWFSVQEDSICCKTHRKQVKHWKQLEASFSLL